MTYVDENGEAVGYEDVFPKRLEMCRKHYEKVGPGAADVLQFAR